MTTGDPLRQPWIAQPEDTVGGWCVTVGSKRPSEGNTPLADFMTEAVAHHVVDLHNAWLDAQEV